MAGRNATNRLHRITLETFDRSPDWVDIVEVLPYLDNSEIKDRALRRDNNGMLVYAINRQRQIRLAFALRAWSFERTVLDESGAPVYDADGVEKTEPWPLPDDPDRRLDEIAKLDGALGTWLGIAAEEWYDRSRIAPLDPTNATASSSTSPASTAVAQDDTPSSPTAGDAGTASSE